MGFLMSGLGSPVGGAITNALGAWWQSRLQNRFQQQQVDPINRAAQQEVADIGGTVPQAQQLSDRGIRLAESAYSPAATEGRFNRYLGGVVPGYQNLREGARNLVQQESGQEFADIRRTGATAEQEALSNLASRGLATSTVAPSVSGSIREQTGAELNRARDARTGRLLGVEQTFGAAVPQAQFNVGQVGMQAQDAGFQNRIAALQGFGTLPIDTRLQVGQQRLGYYGSPILTPPGQFNPISVMGYGGWQRPS